MSKRVLSDVEICELLNYIQSMDESELRVAVTAIPSEVLIDELSKRVLSQERIISECKSLLKGEV